MRVLTGEDSRPLDAPPVESERGRAPGGAWALAAKCLVVTLLIFGIAHAVEGWAMQDVPTELIHTLHAVRGLLVGTAVAVLVARHYRRDSARELMRCVPALRL